jgi:hypothetical protein
MSESTPVAIVRQSVTVSLTFTSKPSDSERQALKDKGYKFENGQWYRNQTDSRLTTQAEVQQLLMAS